MSENSLEPGDSIAGYSILHKIGEGGYGVVYAAADPSGGRVAIKILRPELAGDASIRERLSREVAALSAVSSDRTAKIIASNLDGDRPLIVMEFVEGLTLDQHVRARGPLTGAMATSVALAIAEGLLEVHRNGIVHRDLKPSNIMIGPDGVKILDFGIALLAEANDFTRTGTVLGSTIWMSPEQIAGGDVGTSSDVFALGLVLAFALTGEHPYGKGRPEALMYRIDQGTPDLSSVSGPLKPVIEALLRRQGSDRPGLDAVISQLNGTSSSNEPLSPAKPANGKVTSASRPVDRTTVLPTSPVLEPQKSKRPKTRKIFLTFVGFLLPANAFVWPLYLSRDSQTSTPPATTAAVAASTTVTATVATTSIAPASTTTGPIRVASTTLPPTPVYKLAGSDGYTFRWNQCENPISIYLNNSDGSLSNSELAAVGKFLGEQAIELSDITGHLILYRGLTDERTSATYTSGEKILIQISDRDEGIPLEEEFWVTRVPSFGRRSGSTVEIDSFQIHLLSSAFTSTPWTQASELPNYLKNSMMFLLGEAFGLTGLAPVDFAGFGVTNESAYKIEKMYWQGTRSGNPVWGPGDRIGMLLAQAGSCF